MKQKDIKYSCGPEGGLKAGLGVIKKVKEM
jgi:hypothetical protein